jgi:wyosine [tRNA(Phe)-imidazoG37] synthetase (radical SAM superfamily)
MDIILIHQRPCPGKEVIPIDLRARGRYEAHRRTTTMNQGPFLDLPSMLYADSRGRIFDHPRYRMAGFSGNSPAPLEKVDLIPMPEFSKLFFIPDCPPVGLDPESGKYRPVPKVKINGKTERCCSVAAFLEPGIVRTHLPAADYRPKKYLLPMWAYTAVGFREGRYWAAGYSIEYNPKWDPRHYDDRKLVTAIRSYRKKHGRGPLLEHLFACATNNHCFAAKNLFLKRWEAPLPVSRGCNSECLGCLSLQKDPSCTASHQRISFKPAVKEIVSLAVRHLHHAEEAIVSFGQGCEGEPLTEYELIAESIRQIRGRTSKGTINLNTNGSWPDRVRQVAESGLDSIRISINSCRRDLYRAYYRPRDYDFDDVVSSIELSRKMDLYTMINYLVFPGVTDQEDEIEALTDLIRKTGLNFVHLKNLCIDPQLYVEKMPKGRSKAIGMKKMVSLLKQEFPKLELGYFNQPVR